MALNLRPAPVAEGDTPDPSPAKGPPDGSRAAYPSPTPNIIDSLMGEVVFETFTPRCAMHSPTPSPTPSPMNG